MEQSIRKAMYNLSTQWSQDQNQAFLCNIHNKKHFFSTWSLMDQVKFMIGFHNMGDFAFYITSFENMGIEMVE